MGQVILNNDPSLRNGRTLNTKFGRCPNCRREHWYTEPPWVSFEDGIAIENEVAVYCPCKTVIRYTAEGITAES